METDKDNSFIFFEYYTICSRDVIVFATVFIFVRWLLLSKRSYNRRINHVNQSAHSLPYPQGLPFFGNMFSLRTDMRDTLRKWTNEIGGLFRLRIGPNMDIVVISDVDAMQEAFVDQADAFSDRTIPPLLDVAMGKGGSSFFASGNSWKNLRRFGHKALRVFGLGQRSMENRVIEEGRILVQTCEMKEGSPFNPKLLITKAVGNIITSFGLGSRFDYGDPVFEKLINDFEQFSKSFSFSSLGNIFPLLYYTPLYTNFRRPIQDIFTYIKSVVKEHQQSFDPLDVRDIVDLHLAEMKERCDQNGMGVIEEGSEWKLIFELHVAAMATTSDTLQWAILIVAQHPELMQQIQKEIDDVIGEGRSPKLTDQIAMPLTEATLMETSRFRPVTPLGVPHYTTRDAIVQGYHIPKDTIVLMNLWETLNSPKYWNEPDKFNPYRFLSEDRQSIVNHRAHIPFGIGLRVCLGEKLAKMELFIIFTSLLQRFTFRLADDSLSVGMKGKAGVTYTPLDYNIILEKRYV